MANADDPDTSVIERGGEAVRRSRDRGRVTMLGGGRESGGQGGRVADQRAAQYAASVRLQCRA